MQKQSKHTSKELTQLKRGKEFQKIVQADYDKNSKGGGVLLEESVSYKDMPDIKQKWQNRQKRFLKNKLRK